ncbi:hypothetical protein CN131_30810 [Sinorhizobium meliloti]|nr:hypothetical protein CN131_30810 [Sinorhizobium meliloti]
MVALIPEHEFEGDGKSFPSRVSPYCLGGSSCVDELSSRIAAPGGTVLSDFPFGLGEFRPRTAGYHCGTYS